MLRFLTLHLFISVLASIPNSKIKKQQGVFCCQAGDCNMFENGPEYSNQPVTMSWNVPGRSDSDIHVYIHVYIQVYTL